MSKINIRPCNSDDLDQIIVLCELHAKYEQSEYNPTGKKELLAGALFSNNPPLSIVVADLYGELIGYVSFMKQFSTWDAQAYVYLDCIFIKEEYRSQGLGPRLMNESKLFAKSKRLYSCAMANT